MEPEQKAESISLREFLETTPPGRTVSLAATSIREYSGGNFRVMAPQIELHCGISSCERFQFFQPREDEIHLGQRFLIFTCKNCGSTQKTFALTCWRDSNGKFWAYKFGETPRFGPPLPAKLLQLAGDLSYLLKKGKQAENQNLGIGAFAYYRRIVEEQKSRLIDELVNATKRLGGNTKTFETFEEARQETQFTRALELMASVTPKELFVSGQNPLKLLRGPLSVGLDGLTDEDCLMKAQSIRVVMAALLERIQLITEEKAELDAAIEHLLS